MVYSTNNEGAISGSRPRATCMALILSLLASLLVSCDRGAGGAPGMPAAGEEVQASLCIDPQQANPEAVCTMDYTPVCGCDGKTYSNSCAASSAGVTRWEAGECGSTGQEK